MVEKNGGGTIAAAGLVVREGQQGMVHVERGESFALALEPKDMDGALKLAGFAAKIQMGGVKSLEDALLRIMHGRAIGLTSMQALQFVYNINGRSALDATVQRGLVLQFPMCEQFECIETTDEKATFRGKRKGQEAKTITWTMDMARRAKLDQKDNWRYYPASMLRARASSDLAKLLFPEAIAGMPCKEELEDVAYTERLPTQQVSVTHTVVNEGAPAPTASPDEASEPIVQAEARDYDAEVSALRSEINVACGSTGSKEARKTVKDKIQACDLPEHLKNEVVKAFNEAMEPLKAAAKKAKEEAAAKAAAEAASSGGTDPAATP